MLKNRSSATLSLIRKPDGFIRTVNKGERKYLKGVAYSRLNKRYLFQNDLNFRYTNISQVA